MEKLNKVLKGISIENMREFGLTNQMFEELKNSQTNLANSLFAFQVLHKKLKNNSTGVTGKIKKM